MYLLVNSFYVFLSLSCGHLSIVIVFSWFQGFKVKTLWALWLLSVLVFVFEVFKGCLRSLRVFLKIGFC